MKKLLIIILLLGGVVLMYAWKSSSSVNDVNSTGNETGSFRPDPTSATFIFDDAPVTLSNGQAEGEVEETTLLEEIAYGDLNADGKEDSAVLLARSGGGSGVFIYVAGYISGPVNYKGTNAAFLGDRVAPKNISINNGVVTVTYLDRGPDEALAAEPTISASKRFVYRNGEFVER